MKLKSFNSTNVTNTKQFTAACREVFAGVKARNNQIQQLLELGLAEAKRESGGQVTNNLTWLSMVLNMAEEAKGINATKVAEYVKIELCLNTVSWDKKAKQLKKRGKDMTLAYKDSDITVAWYDYGKPDTVDRAFDYGKGIINAIKKAQDPEKGNMTAKDIIGCLAQAGMTIDSILETMAELDEAEAA